MDSPMKVSVNSSSNNGYGKLLRIIPHDEIAFTKSGSVLDGHVKITNIHTKHVTYKIKTTCPKTFTVTPNIGVLAPSASVTVNIVRRPDQPMNIPEKFLIICKSLNVEELWKNPPVISDQIEHHKLKCSIPADLEMHKTYKTTLHVSLK